MKKILYLSLFLLCLYGCGENVAPVQFLVAGSGNNSIQIIDKLTTNTIWKFDLSQGQECNSITMTKEENILFATKTGAKLISLDKELIWEYVLDTLGEVQFAGISNKGNIVLGICGTPARILEFDENRNLAKTIAFDTKIENHHGQFRQLLMTEKETYLVPLLSSSKVIEVDKNGDIVKEALVQASCFSAMKYKEGQIILPCGDAHSFKIYDWDKGQTVNTVATLSDSSIELAFVAQLFESNNDNFLLCNWTGHLEKKSDDIPQIIELNEKGEVCWKIKTPNEIGMVSAIYVLKTPIGQKN